MKNRTKELRRAKRMTVPELAKKLGISVRSLNYIESGEILTLQMAVKISQFFEVSLDELILHDSINSDSSKLPVDRCLNQKTSNVRVSD